MPTRSLTASALLVPLTLTAALLGCSTDGSGEPAPSSAPSSPAPASTFSPTAPTAPSPSEAPSPSYDDLSVGRTSELVSTAADRFDARLEAQGGAADVAAAQDLFATVRHHPVAYLQGIAFNADGTGWLFCVGSRNGKASSTTSGGEGAVAGLTERDCGGTSDDPLVEADEG